MLSEHCHLQCCSPPGSSAHGISQARLLVQVAIPFFRNLPYPGIEPRSPALQLDSLPSEAPLQAFYTLFYIKGSEKFCNKTKYWFLFLGFPGGLVSKESICSVGDLGLIPGLGRSPGGGHGNPLQYSCLENLHGKRTLEGCSPCGHKELGMTERLSTSLISVS